MKAVDTVFRFFEGMIDPFRYRRDYEPPNRLLGYVWHYVSQTRWAFAALLVYGFVNALVEATVFAFVGEIVDVLTAFQESGLKGTGWSGLLESSGWALLYMLAVVAVLRAVVVIVGALIEEQVIVPGFFVMMRWQSHKHVVGQSLSFFQNDLAGRISQKVFQSGIATGDMMISLLQVIWFIVVYAVTTVGLLATMDWQLSAVIIVWIIAFYLIASHFVPLVQEHSRITAETASVMSGRMVDSYTNVQTTKIYGSEQQEDLWVLDSMKVHREALKRFTRVLTSMRAMLAVVNGIVLSCVGWLSINLWLGDQATLGSVAFALALTLRLHLLSGRLMGQLNGFFRNLGTTQNTMDLVAQPHRLKDVEGAPELVFSGGEIRFEDVSFHYDRAGGLIENFSLTIKPGEKVGIAGPSGGGKTTLVHLAMRFFDPDSGRILIDGQDISKVSQNSLRSCFSLVQQDVQLFHRSVFDNIAYGDAHPSAERVEAAARLAHADEFISSLKDANGSEGYSARVGERGVKLSGGQRQRIALARAIYRDAPILILDEATSQLDSGLEHQIQDNLLKMMRNKTVLVVAHRLSTIAQLDRIVVVDQGSIVDQGTHQQLVRKKGIYQMLWYKQSGKKDIKPGMREQARQ